MKRKSILVGITTSIALALGSAASAASADSKTDTPLTSSNPGILVDYSISPSSTLVYYEADNPGEDRKFTPNLPNDGGVLPNYPRVNKNTGCNKAKNGSFIFSILWGGLVCVPMGIANVGLGFGCGVVGNAITTYVPFNAVCR